VAVTRHGRRAAGGSGHIAAGAEKKGPRASRSSVRGTGPGRIVLRVTRERLRRDSSASDEAYALKIAPSLVEITGTAIRPSSRGAKPAPASAPEGRSVASARSLRSRIGLPCPSIHPLGHQASPGPPETLRRFIDWASFFRERHRLRDRRQVQFPRHPVSALGAFTKSRCRTLPGTRCDATSSWCRSPGAGAHAMS